jgi:hypothetical protein
MSNPAITTAVKMLETLPQTTQSQVVEHLREYIAVLRDELEWEQQFERSQERLQQVGQQVRAQLAAGQTQPLDLQQL